MKKGDSRIPICHGEPMQAVEHYKKDGVMLVTYRCMMRGCQETIDVIEGKEDSTR